MEKETQLAWIKYTRQFVKFANMRYPKVPNYVWNLWLITDHLKQLENYLSDMENMKNEIRDMNK
ncbi:MAG: hypothetical protein ACK5Z5_08860 [Neisseriaceae bacterium]